MSLLKNYIQNKDTAQNLIWRTLQTFGMHGITFLFFLMCAHFLTPYEFGIYNYVLVIIFFLIMFVDFGISKATGKYVAQYNTIDKEKLKSALFNAGLIIFILSLFISILVLFLGRFIFPEQYSYILYLLPLIFLIPLTFLYDSIYSGLKRFKDAAIIFLIVGLISLGVAYFLIVSYGITGAFISWNLFYFSLFIVLSLNYRELEFEIKKTVLREIGEYSILIGTASIFYFFSTRIDVLFIGHYNYITEVGYYEINYKILMLLIIPFLIIGQVISPDITKNFSNKNYTLIKTNFKKYMFISLLMSFFFVIVFILIRDYLFTHYLGKYNTNDLVHLSNCMLPFYFTSMLTGIIGIFAIATGHAKLCMYYIMIVGFLNVVFDYIFINTFGFWGLIYSTMIIKSVSSLLFIYFYYKILWKYETKN